MKCGAIRSIIGVKISFDPTSYDYVPQIIRYHIHYIRHFRATRLPSVFEYLFRSLMIQETPTIPQ